MALGEAIKLAAKLNASMQVLNCYHIPIPAAEMGIGINPRLMDDYTRRAKEDFESWKKELPLFEEVISSFAVDISFPTAGILKAAKEVDIVIMGTHGASGLQEILMGSIASEVMTESKTPVLAIPKGASIGDIRKIALGTDYQHLEATKNLQVLRYLAEQFEAQLEIIHVHPKPSSLVEQEAINALKIDDFFSSLKHNFRFKMMDKVEDGLFAFVSEEKIDLLAVMPKKHNFLARLFQKSITRKLAHHANVPLLSLP